jgi:DNA polymerase-3 subunit delta'
LALTLHPVYGHEPLLSRLEGALTSGRFPQATLFVGPAGVGKQRLALWVAQGLLCDRGPGRPCGECGSCRQVLGLSHPDLHWFVPVVRPKATDPDKQVEEIEELLAEAMGERRANPLYGPPEGMASHPLASIRLLQRRVNLKPYQGARKVVILGKAERLVVQEASQEAANALLKVLEEPPADTFLILTVREAQALLPTIRSRLVPVRVGGVGDGVVRRFLSTQMTPGLKGPALEQRVVLAEGSIGRGLAVGGATGAGEQTADRWLASIRGGPSRWSVTALGQAPWAARGDFTAALDALAIKLRDQAATDAVGNPGRLPRWVAAIRAVERTREEAQGNANPQLALAVLARELEELA